MFKPAEKTELNQISLTGMRAIVMVGLLIMKPRSLEEIREVFIKLHIMEETHSDDILRIDINTLKAMGCKISRSSAKTNFKYVLEKHPFSLKITDNEIKILKKTYNKIKESADIDLLIAYDNLFKKLSFHIYEEDIKEKFLGISILKYYKENLVKDLLCDCKNKNTIELIYHKPTAKKEAKKEVVAHRLVYKNDKIYLYAYDLEVCENIVLNIQRIKSIICRKIKNLENFQIKTTKIKFHLKNYDSNNLEQNEEIIKKTEQGFVVEGVYYNKFLAMQRVLSFGPKCTVLEPLDFKNSIIEKIRGMRKTYEH